MIPEIHALLDKADRSLGAAKLLHEQGYAGFSASRAYYSMFYAAEALPLNIGLSYSKHSGVIAAFGKEFARTSEAMQRLHRYIVDAESVRTVGDYSFDVTVSIEEADKVLGWADEFIVISRQFLAKNSGE